MSLASKWIGSPVGELKLVASDRGLVAVLWQHDTPGRVRLDEAIDHLHHPILQQAEAELAQYFAGERTKFTLPLELRGTPFQQRVWHLLQQIPFGETRTYGQLAAALNDPGAARAVGAANGRNPLSIVVPCHRVVGAAGRLTGFAGGLHSKAWLLALERSRGGLALQ